MDMNYFYENDEKKIRPIFMGRREYIIQTNYLTILI